MRKETTQITFFLVVTSLLIFVLAAFIIFILLLYKKNQAQYYNNLAAIKTEFEKTILNTELEIQEQTMLLIAREIHDNIGLSLSTAKLHLNAINWGDLQHAQTKVKDAISLTGKAIQDMSSLTKKLNTDYIKDNGLLQAIKMLWQDMEKISNIKATYTVTGETTFMEGQKELVIFRIIQEALNNSIKHAEAAHISLQLLYNKEEFIAIIKDDGIGFNTYLQAEGTGLKNIRQRTKMIHGACHITSALQQGTTIQITIPYLYHEQN
jgi:two-component system, NarL family, sensor kinase